MNFTHTSMAKAITDVAEGRMAFACWSSGEGWAATAERSSRGVTLRTINPQGETVAGSLLSRRDLASYKREAKG